MKVVLVVLVVASLAWQIDGMWMAVTFLGVIALGSYYTLLNRRGR
jgi:hypothetical protein